MSDKFSDSYIIQRAIQILTKIEDHQISGCIHCREILEEIYFNKNGCGEPKTPQAPRPTTSEVTRMVNLNDYKNRIDR